jgi:hypothetical protein
MVVAVTSAAPPELVGLDLIRFLQPTQLGE